MYRLICRLLPIDDRRFQIELLHPSVEAFVFTCG